MEETVTISLARYNRLMAENEAAKGEFVQVNSNRDGWYHLVPKDQVIEAMAKELADAWKSYRDEMRKRYELESRQFVKKGWF